MQLNVNCRLSNILHAILCLGVQHQGGAGGGGIVFMPSVRPCLRAYVRPSVRDFVSAMPIVCIDGFSITKHLSVKHLGAKMNRG